MTPPPSKRRSSLGEFLLTFALILIVTQLGLRFLFPDAYRGGREAPSGVELRPERRSFTVGNGVVLLLENTRSSPLSLPDHCPAPPVLVARRVEQEWREIDAGSPVIPCASLLTLGPQETIRIDLSPWKYHLFPEPGTYRFTLLEVGGEGSGTGTTTTVRVKSPNVFTALFRGIILKPLYNTLLLLGSIIPDHSLGWSIILLTVLVKVLLFLPSKHALEGQRKLQAVQPKIDVLKKKYGHDQKRLSEETLQVWREHGVNPFRSCLPTIIQIPILIGLFFVVRDGADTALNRHLLYGVWNGAIVDLEPIFLGLLDLRVPNFTVFPLALFLLQFWQMRMMFIPPPSPPKSDQQRSWLERIDQRTIMNYGLPLMVAGFAVTLPSAVSLYWAVSTLFAILQQVVMTRGVKAHP